MMCTEAEKDQNLLDIVKIALVELRGETYQTRRRGVMVISTLLGHKMGVDQLRDQPWGTVGECDRCGQVAKAPRASDTIEGRATENLCPSRTR